MKKNTRLSADVLKRTVDHTSFEFETTKDVPALLNIVGQERGRKVMEFGLTVDKVGYNLYVSGIAGTGRTTFTESIVNQFADKEVELHDWCYVYNFADGYKPKTLQLPAGMGKRLKEAMAQLLENLKTDIPKAFNEENYQKERASIIREHQERNREITESINEIAKKFGFVIRQSGSGVMTIPVVDGEPITEEQFRSLPSDRLKEIEQQSARLQGEILGYTDQLRKLQKDMRHVLERLDTRVARSATGYHIDELKKEFQSCQDVITYLDEVQNDIIQNLEDFLPKHEKQSADPLSQMMAQSAPKNDQTRYEVNLLVDNSQTKGAPVITADNPSYYNIIGKVDYQSRMGVMSTNFTKIKPGYLHYANGGYLIIQAKDLFTKPHAWEGLKLALLNRKLKIENIGEQTGLVTTTSISPEPIPLDLKVIIIGNRSIYQILYQHDEDFQKLFKIKADFDVEMDFNRDNMTRMASFIRTHCVDHDLLDFDRTAVAKMVEYSTRLAGHQDKLSTRFNQQVDIIYEADAWARLEDETYVTEKHITKAISEKVYRNNLLEEKVQESIEEGTILIDTDGTKTGQVNGLSVYSLGQYSFGKPSRITVTTFIGKNGIINIERKSELSGSVHNKGVYILGGYLGQKFAQKHALALTAHIAFEQSYGGVDGDSASSTELYALLSRLADVPIDQGIAVTGSINQKGEIQPIGGVNEKIEGYYTVCKNKGLTGKQGVLIPKQNVKNLMLHDDVIAAVKAGQFHVYAVETVEEGIEILTGLPAGQMNEHGEYNDNSLYRKVADTLARFSQLSQQRDHKD